MKTQSISFQGGVKVDRYVSPELTKAIKKSPAMKRFGLLYSADVSQITIGSSKNKDVSYSGLFVDNVKPRSILTSIFDFVTGRQNKRYRGFSFNSGRETDAGLADLLGKMKKNSFVKMIIEKY